MNRRCISVWRRCCVRICLMRRPEGLPVGETIAGREGRASACFAHISLVVFSQYSLITSSCHIWYSPLHLGFGGRRRRRRKDQYILVTERVTPDAATERGRRTRSGVPVDSCESLGVAPRVTAPVSCVCARDEELVKGPFLKGVTSPLSQNRARNRVWTQCGLTQRALWLTPWPRGV